MSNKLLIGLVILQLIVIIFVSKRNTNHYNYLKVQEMVDSLSSKTEQEIFSKKYIYELNKNRSEAISRGLDKIENLVELKSYTQKVPVGESEKEIINYLLQDFESLNQQQRKLVISIIRYLSIKSIEKLNFESYFQFENIYIQPSAINSTINLGETYEVFLPICGKSESLSTVLILEGDTVKTESYMNYYTEQPSTTGKIKRSGFMLVKIMDKELKMPIEFEYTVVDKE